MKYSGGSAVLLVGLLSCTMMTALGQATSVPAETSQKSCDTLAHSKLQNTRIVAAGSVAGALPAMESFAPSWTGSATGAKADARSSALSHLPAFCRVLAQLTPVPGSNIVIEVWLPDKWNGKLLSVGNHGYAGEFERAYMAMGLLRGYAVAATDTGHSAKDSPNAEFSVRNDAAVEDFAWRAVHEMTVAAKAIIRLRYGVYARRTYFDGCSNGGREAMREAQQFPADYDGIISGSPGVNWTGFMASDLNEYRAGALGAGVRMTPEKLALATRASVGKCDLLDGVKDGVLADPTLCHWDPHEVQCKAGDDQTKCLTASEANAIARVESPILDPRTGQTLYPGMEPGSEKFWMIATGQMGALNAITSSFYKMMVAHDPAWDSDKADVILMLRKSEEPGSPGVMIDSLNPDLSAFRDRGGKLIQYHGWNDPAMAPRFSPEYYAKVVDLQPGPDKLGQTQRFFRLFMVPGMAHCWGGDGPVNFGALGQQPTASIDAENDVLEALDRWSAQGIPPARIIATQFADTQQPARKMPLCPWPEIAMYVAGDVNEATSFACKVPARPSSK